jgi:riboflavin synthase
MFSGIIEELGRVAGNTIGSDGRLEIVAARVTRDVAVGDSIAVNGCCLTVVDLGTQGFVADVMPETARRTTLAELRSGDVVNLEAAMAYGDRVGGHLVSGHVDATGRIRDTRDEGNAVWVTIDAPPGVMRYVVEKGCVAIDGISLTVASVDGDHFTVSLIPHTVTVTTAQDWQAGTQVNLEADLFAKYVERSVAAHAAAHAAV